MGTGDHGWDFLQHTGFIHFDVNCTMFVRWFYVLQQTSVFPDYKSLSRFWTFRILNRSKARRDTCKTLHFCLEWKEWDKDKLMKQSFQCSCSSPRLTFMSKQSKNTGWSQDSVNPLGNMAFPEVQWTNAFSLVTVGRTSILSQDQSENNNIYSWLVVLLHGPSRSSHCTTPRLSLTLFFIIKNNTPVCLNMLTSCFLVNLKYLWLCKREIMQETGLITAVLRDVGGLSLPRLFRLQTKHKEHYSRADPALTAVLQRIVKLRGGDGIPFSHARRKQDHYLTPKAMFNNVW